MPDYSILGLTEAQVTALINIVLPSGTIILWSGSIATIPTGWHLCDGNAGTPDLLNKFMVCAYQDEGGVAKANMLDGSGLMQSGGGSTYHSHGTPAWYNHNYDQNGGTQDGAVYYIDGNTGGNYSIPSFFALAYIMKL